MSPDDGAAPGGSDSPGSAFDIPSDAAGIEGLAAVVAGRRPATCRRSPACPCPRPPLGTGRLESASIGPFTLESGVALPVTVAYRHDGPGPDAPQVLVDPCAHRARPTPPATGGHRSSARAGRSTRTGSASCAPTSSAGATARRGRPPIDPATGAPVRRRLPAAHRARRGRALLWALADRLGHRAVRARRRRVAGRHGRPGGGARAARRPWGTWPCSARRRPRARMAIAWNHIQLELIDALGERGPRRSPASWR